MCKIKSSIIKGLSFGLASGIVTTLGLMVGLYSGTRSSSVVIAGILTIALADALSDAFGIHLSEESSNTSTTTAEVWESTVATFAAKLIFALTFVVPVLLLPLDISILLSIAWGLFLLAVVSIVIADWRKESRFAVVAEHWGITIFVVMATYGVGLLINHFFPIA